MWIIDALNTFGNINFAPTAIISGSLVAMATAALIITERKRIKAKDASYETVEPVAE